MKFCFRRPWKWWIVRQNSKRVPLLHSLRRLQNLVSPEKGGWLTVNGVDPDKGEKVWYQLLRCLQHLISTYAVKCIPKVQLKDYFIWLKVVQVDTGCMNSSLISQWCSISQLVWGQQCSHITHDLVTGSLAARRWRVQPTAMGLTPRSFFSRVAPKKKGQMDVGVFPSRMRLIKEVRALYSADTPVMSLRCCGFRLSGPPAEPLGKESMALATTLY